MVVQELVEDFVFTASKVLLQCRKNQGDIQQLDQVVPVCSSPATIMATFELLISLVTGCLSNLRALSDMITAMFYSSGWHRTISCPWTVVLVCCRFAHVSLVLCCRHFY